MTDRELKRALAELSGLRSEAEPIVSLYLSTSWTDEKQRDRARVFVQDAVRHAIDRRQAHPQLPAIRRTLARVAQAPVERAGRPGEGDGQARGLAIFGNEALGLWRMLESPQPFKDELCLDARPHLLQLARLSDDAEPALVAFVHDRGLQLYEVALGTLVSEATIEGAVPRRHGATGGAALERERKNQRHVEELVQRVRRDAAAQLVKLHDRDPRQHVILVGTAEKVADLERMLPERVRDAVLARLPRPPGRGAWSGPGKLALVREAVEAIARHEREAEAEQVEHAIGEAMRGGLAVLGPEDVVLAVNERRVHRLILEEDFARSGWRCHNCGALGTTHDEVCRFCQGALARVDALGEELAGRVLAEDGEVEVVAHTNRLHSYDGVAALLRQARARGLSGREAEAPRG